MSLERAHYVMCDLCGNPAEIVTDGAPAARKLAKAEGFIRRRIKGQVFDLCKQCAPAPPTPKES
jgi:hypothetical protein